MRIVGVICVGFLAAWISSAASPLNHSDIILQRPNTKSSEAMPLGNGRLGLAVWSAEGLTIQLNRADTLPKRLSPGQVVLPGLTKLTSAADYSGRLDLSTGEFVEQGNGITVRVYLEPDIDVAVVEVSGLEPNSPQTAVLKLWQPRHPAAQTEQDLAVLSETWKDTEAFGASGQTFGSLAGISVDADSPTVTEADPLTAKLSFSSTAGGSFRLFIAAPHWVGGDALQSAASLLTAARHTPVDSHRFWWSKFWKQAGFIETSSPDGSAEYLENLRDIDLFLSAAENGDKFPGSQAGIADLFSSAQDLHKWDPSAYWHYNLRMQVAANLGSGLFAQNEPYFNLYRANLENIQNWTKAHMRGLPGACVPETMRFNGQGYENEDWIKTPGLNCDAASPPYYNARTLSTGAEVSQWIWRQYLATDDREFLARNYPVMAASARFLLAYSKVGPDKKRHTQPTNAHENEWDVKDSTNDICAMRTLFPELMEASRILGRDQDLAHQAKEALQQIVELPQAGDSIGESYTANAEIHNTENVGLEPVWPYGLIGDEGLLHELGLRTYQTRPNMMQNDWSFDPLQAARLGLAGEVRDTLIGLTNKYQTFPSGLSSFIGDEFYVEQMGVVAAALQEALVQDYDDVLRIAPAWPKDWDVSGTVYIQHQSRVEVDFRAGTIRQATIYPGFSGKMRVRNPWPTGSADAILNLTVERGQPYLLKPSGSHEQEVPVLASKFPSGPRTLGSNSIGLPKR